MAAAVQHAQDAAESERLVAQGLRAKRTAQGEAAASPEPERRAAGSVWLQWHAARRMERAGAAAEELRAAKAALVYAALLSDAPEAHEALAMFRWRIEGECASARQHLDRAIALRSRGGGDVSFFLTVTFCVNNTTHNLTA